MTVTELLETVRRVEVRTNRLVQSSSPEFQLLRIAAPGASDIVSVLNELGGKYNNLTTWEHDEFEVPYDENHRAVFRILHDANVCKTTKRKLSLVVRRP